MELVVGSSLLALLAGIFLALWVKAQPSGEEKMKKISDAIKEGAMAYLKRQYKTLLPIIIILALILNFAINSIAALTFLLGSFCSALAGFIGMNVTVRANVRVANKAKKGLKKALDLAIKGGSVTGLMVVGLGLLGITALYLVLGKPELLIGFGFGASLISLFMRVGGGIYTKAADVGADLVGKVEKGIPEDDPRNPAVIADQVGDNVGDCAGMAADVFESYVVTLIASMLLGISLGIKGIIYPLLICSAGIIASLIGILSIRLGKDRNIWKALNRGIVIACIFAAIGFFLITYYFFDQFNLFYASLTGIITTLAICWITDYFTSRERKPVQQIAQASKTGAGTNIITGLAMGMLSTLPSVIVICIAIFVSYYFAGVYGISIAATGMLALSGIIIAIDSYGPITDNAGGIAEMSGLPAKVRKVTDALDAVGNTTKAVTKGFAIGSAALAALSIFDAFAEAAGISSFDLLNSQVLVGLFIGGALPFLFSSFCLSAVGRAAFSIIEEVRRQFKEIKGLLQGKAKPDYARCVDISTRAALKELILPGILAILSPLIVGFILGPEALGGLLGGAIITGLLLALFLANAGAAWDNAKKYIEAGVLGGKGSEAHKAAVIGDTVGDPCKDTAGPSLNPLIKVINMISLLFASLIAIYALL